MQIIINLSNEDVNSLKHDLVDIEAWVQDAVGGKISKSKDRMIAEWLPKLLADQNISTIPADKSLLIKEIRSQPDYKDRNQRDAETTIS